LEEIELRIIRQVLEEENGVISRAAERLNVGRSTLWRKLRDADKQQE
jgi:transcriptional regulator